MNISLVHANKSWDNKFSEHYQWRTFNFVIYSPSQDLTQRIAVIIEKVYDKITDDLGYAFYKIPKDKIPIYIFRNQWDYVKYTQMPVWSGGYANTTDIAVFSFPQAGLIRSIIPHELTHLVFNTYMGEEHFPKLKWLSEGLAVYEQRCFEGEKINTKATKRIVQKGGYIPFKEMVSVNPPQEIDHGKVNYWYLTVSSVVAFLLEEKGKDNFHEFCRILKTSKNVNYALSKAYSWDFSDLEGLEERWLEFMGAKRKEEAVVKMPSSRKTEITAEFTKRDIPAQPEVKKKRLLDSFNLEEFKFRLNRIKNFMYRMNERLEELREKMRSNMKKKDGDTREKKEGDKDGV